jgi:hypothetical protein
MSTPKSLRTQPQRVFENYTLMRTLGPEIGMAKLSDGLFQNCAGIGYSDDVTSSILDIGFDFSFNGTTYKKFVANTNGWLALVDPTRSTFSHTEILNSYVYNNADIKINTFDYNHVLIAPWFDDIRNVAETLNQYGSFSAAKSERIRLGLEPYPLLVNQALNSTKYYNDNRSESGRRLIVRWNSISGYDPAVATTVLRFEAIIYENGKIEFRYALKNNLQLEAASVYEGATIGVFVKGVNNFRDFAYGLDYKDLQRQKYKYGGCTYQASYTDTDASPNGLGTAAKYTCMLQAQSHWPSLSDTCCMFTLSPPVNRRKILPRLLQRDIDSRTTFPNSSNFSGKNVTHKNIFDDRKPAFYGLLSRPDAIEPGSGLDNQGWFLPRYTNYGYYCSCPMDVTTIKQLTGDINWVYNVKLRVRGVVEFRNHTGGESISTYFYRSGTPNDYYLANDYSLSISDPPEYYWLNNAVFSNTVHVIDYEITIQVRGGASVTLYATSNGGEEIDNVVAAGGPLTVPSVTWIPQPYAGQFIVLTYISSEKAYPISTAELAAISSSYTGLINVNYPTTLPRFYSETEPSALLRQDIFSGDFETTGTINNFASEQFIGQEYPTYISPYTENRQFEADNSTLFFASGSSLDVSYGLQSPLNSKTKIEISLPVNNSITLQRSASAIYYYNSRFNTWNVPQNSTYTLSRVSDAPGSKNDISYDRTAQSQLFSIIEDHHGFGPIGNFIASGSSDIVDNYDQTSENIGSYYTRESYIDAISTQYDKTITINEDYCATEDEVVKIPITQPFLVEKIVVELPLAAGNDWFQDRTTCISTLETNGQGFDFGGPGLTFALFNQSTRTGKRDLITTGTITHAYDVERNLILSKFPSINSTYQLRPEGFAGFSSEPTAIISQENGNTFTGSVQLNCDVLVGNGACIKVEFAMTSSDYAANRNGMLELLGSQKIKLESSYIGATYEKSCNIAYVNPFGRRATGFEPSPRSIFGKEFTTANNITNSGYITNPFCLLTGALSGSTSSLVAPLFLSSLPEQFSAALQEATFKCKCEAVVPLENSTPSPYLLIPGDSLVVAISKSRPVYMGSLFDTETKTTGSIVHDVQLITGTLFISMYGSLLRENKEYHNTLNQQLTSNALHETQCIDSIVDQFETEYKDSYTSGSNSDYIAGNLLSLISAPHGRMIFTSSERGRVFSKTTPHDSTLGTSNFDQTTSLSKRLQPCFELAGTTRLTQCFDEAERFWDSLMPNFTDCMAVDGNKIVTYEPITGPLFGQIIFDYRIPSVLIAQPNYAKEYNWKWTKSCPFEPRYVKVSRQAKTSKFFISDTAFVYPGTIVSITPIKHEHFVFGTIGVENPYSTTANTTEKFTYHNQLLTDRPYAEKDTSPYQTTSADLADIMKVLYGFGDMNNMMMAGTLIGAGIGGPIGSNHFAQFRYRSSGGQCVSPIIRGWKYGVYSALPTFTRAYYRNGHYGHFRDMLEQRQYSKFYISSENNPEHTQNTGVTTSVVSVKFVDSNGKLTRPEYTHSQNLSTEVTSSLPYFDCETRNRFDTTTFNDTVIKVKADSNGNITI